MPPPGTIPAQIGGWSVAWRRRRRTATAGERFLHELSRHPTPAPRPLPVEYRPLATAIVGERRPVRVSTSHASRRALARAGKRAATTGDTIHLDRPRPAPEVIAHELTHVAHPSPTPRFFADDDRGPEERHAERVSAIIRRSPILPARSTAATATPTAASGTISAATLAASITGTATDDRIQRKQTTLASPPTTPPTPASPPTPATTTGPTTSATLAQFEHILELLEDRILTELERRGGRYRGGF